MRPAGAAALGGGHTGGVACDSGGGICIVVAGVCGMQIPFEGEKTAPVEAGAWHVRKMRTQVAEAKGALASVAKTCGHCNTVVVAWRGCVIDIRAVAAGTISVMDATHNSVAARPSM